MELVNHTPLATHCIVTDVDATGEPFGMIVAKATYGFDSHGCELETQSPFPVFLDDEPHPYGVIPCDLVPRHAPLYEVLVLGAACAEGDAPIHRRDVSVRVGSFRRDLAVFGDRHWKPGPGDGFQASAPEPFLRMPITWDRAFGGRMLVEIDPEAFLEFTHQQNPLGRGALLGTLVEPLRTNLGLAPPYPIWREDDRLPNVEDPEHLVADRADAPPPVGIAPVPRIAPLLGGRVLELLQTPNPPVEEYVTEALLRAHASMVLRSPPYGGEVFLEGFAPGPAIVFELPKLEVFIDFDSGEKPTTLRAAPHVLLILPDERKFSVTYRSHFRLASGARSARLRAVGT